MEETSLNSVVPLQQNGEDEKTLHHNLNNNSISSKAVQQPIHQPGNEENAPENSRNKDEEARRRNLPRFRVFKKMRLGRSPQKGSITMSKFFISKKNRDSTSSKNEKRVLFDPSTGHPTKALSPPSQVVQNNAVAAELIEWPTDNPAMLAPVVAPASNNDPVPSLEKAPSEESRTESITETSSCVSGNSRNWLDDFGKQNKGHITTEDRQGHSISSIQQAPAKDPRFHSKRKVQPHQTHHDRSFTMSFTDNPAAQPGKAQPNQTHHDGIFADNIAQPGSPLFPTNSIMEESQQVFLAPVIVPPSSIINSRGRRSIGEIEASKESPRIASPPRQPAKRSSAFEADHAAIAAAQEAPDLLAASETSSSESTSSMASALIKRLVNATKDTSKARVQQCPRQTVRSTPIRIKPRVKTQEVKATDQGYASVAKLSAWLADDPTSTKKVRHVRRGANVIAKSRQFEKDLEDVIVEENNISSGAVKEKKDWLKSAFHHHDEHGDHEGEEEEEDFFHHDPNRHMMMMRTRPVNLDDDCARSEFVVKDDSASSISVSNKKKWLENAFKKEDGSGSTQKSRIPSKAMSDIGPVRESRDDVTSSAKKMWRQKTERRAVGGPPTSASKPRTASSPYRNYQRPPTTRDLTPRKTLEDRMRATLGTSRASAPSSTISKAANAAAAHEDKLASRHSVVGVPLEEDTTPVDFRAARQLLIQRSKNNGNEVKIASKVQRKTDKFERLNKDTKRRSSVTGLLKPTWESNLEAETEEAQGPSDAYTKAFVEDIAPKRSFDELP